MCVWICSFVSVCWKSALTKDVPKKVQLCCLICAYDLLVWIRVEPISSWCGWNKVEFVIYLGHCHFKSLRWYQTRLIVLLIVLWCFWIWPYRFLFLEAFRIILVFINLIFFLEWVRNSILQIVLFILYFVILWKEYHILTNSFANEKLVRREDRVQCLIPAKIIN